MGGPLSLVGERQGTMPTPPRPRATAIQPQVGTSIALALGRGGNGIVEAFVSRLTSPKRRAPRPKGQRLSLDFRGTLLAKRPFGRGARNEVFFLCRCFSRDKGEAIPTGQCTSQPDGRQRRRISPSPKASPKGRLRGVPGRLIYFQPANFCRLLRLPRPVVASFSSRGAAARRAFSLASQPKFTRLTLGGPPRRHATKLNSVPTSRLR